MKIFHPHKGNWGYSLQCGLAGVTGLPWPLMNHTVVTNVGVVSYIALLWRFLIALLFLHALAKVPS